MAIGYEASVQTRCVLSLIWTHVEMNDFLDRYFEGIQGDNAKQGELFGIKNIFKLHEDKLATKMAVSTQLEKKNYGWNIGRNCGFSVVSFF